MLKSDARDLYDATDPKAKIQRQSILERSE